jgi:hypothetical protein
LKPMRQLPFVGSRVIAITQTIFHEEVIPFYLVLGIVMFTFSAATHVAFGTEIFGYRSFGDTSWRTFLIVMGEIDDYNTDSMTYVLTFFLLLFLLVLVLMNIFIAVVSNVYTKTEENSVNVYETELDKYQSSQGGRFITGICSEILNGKDGSSLAKDVAKARLVFDVDDLTRSKLVTGQEQLEQRLRVIEKELKIKLEDMSGAQKQLLAIIKNK